MREICSTILGSNANVLLSRIEPVSYSLSPRAPKIEPLNIPAILSSFNNGSTRSYPHPPRLHGLVRKRKCLFQNPLFEPIPITKWASKPLESVDGLAQQVSSTKFFPKQSSTKVTSQHYLTGIHLGSTSRVVLSASNQLTNVHCFRSLVNTSYYDYFVENSV